MSWFRQWRKGRAKIWYLLPTDQQSLGSNPGAFLAYKSFIIHAYLHMGTHNPIEENPILQMSSLILNFESSKLLSERQRQRSLSGGRLLMGDEEDFYWFFYRDTNWNYYLEVDFWWDMSRRNPASKIIRQPTPIAAYLEIQIQKQIEIQMHMQIQVQIQMQLTPIQHNCNPNLNLRAIAEVPD